MVNFDMDKYYAAMKNFSTIVRPYMVVDGSKRFLSPDAPNNVKKAYKEALYWDKQKIEWQRITGEHFR